MSKQSQIVTKNSFSMRKNGHRTSPVTLLVPISGPNQAGTSTCLRGTQENRISPPKYWVSLMKQRCAHSSRSIKKSIFPGLREIGSLFGTETSSPSVVRWEPFFGEGQKKPSYRLGSNVINYIALTNIHLKPRLKLCHSLASLEEEEEEEGEVA